MDNVLFDPETWLKLNLPKGFRNKLLTKKLDLRKGILQSLIISSAVNKTDLNSIIFDTIDKYEKKINTLEQEGVSESAATKEAVNNESLLKTRVENYLIYEESQALKNANLGKRYIWLPSSSKVPRPSHQIKYGKVYTAGKGEFPNEAYGCKCGFMFID